MRQALGYFSSVTDFPVTVFPGEKHASGLWPLSRTLSV